MTVDVFRVSLGRVTVSRAEEHHILLLAIIEWFLFEVLILMVEFNFKILFERYNNVKCLMIILCSILMPNIWQTDNVYILNSTSERAI